MAKIPDYQEWTDWALNNGIDTRIVTFINAYPAKLMGKINTKSNDMAFPTPRSWSKSCSSLIEGIDNINMIEDLASSAVGRGCAMEFSSFLKFQKQINWTEILNNPKKASEIKEMEMKYALLSRAAEWYGIHYKPNDLEKILQIADNIQAEFAILLLRFAKVKHESSFKKNAPKQKTWKRIWEKYGKYFEV